MMAFIYSSSYHSLKMMTITNIKDLMVFQLKHVKLSARFWQTSLRYQQSMIYGIVMCHIGGKPLCLANEHFSNIPAIRLPLDGSRPCPICYTVKSKQSRKRHSDTRPADMFSWWRVDVVIMKAKSVTGAVSLSYLSINLTCYVIGFPNALRTDASNFKGFY